MSVSTTIDKLVEMRMTTMSEMFMNQQNDPKMKDIPFEERFAMLVDAEHASRKSHAFERLVKKAELEQKLAALRGKRIFKAVKGSVVSGGQHKHKELAAVLFAYSKAAALVNSVNNVALFAIIVGRLPRRK